jgi:hypothetical protein
MGLFPAPFSGVEYECRIEVDDPQGSGKTALMPRSKMLKAAN